jgi:hypothetical protein
MGEQAERQVFAGGGDMQLVKELSIPLAKAKGWMKLLGVLFIIYGVILAITVVGLIICWLPIWMGILLFKSASAAEVALAAGDKRELHTALEKIKMYFTIQGILALIGLVFAIISFAVSGGAMLHAIRSGMMRGGY